LEHMVANFVSQFQHMERRLDALQADASTRLTDTIFVQEVTDRLAALEAVTVEPDLKSTPRCSAPNRNVELVARATSGLVDDIRSRLVADMGDELTRCSEIGKAAMDLIPECIARTQALATMMTDITKRVERIEQFRPASAGRSRSLSPASVEGTVGHTAPDVTGTADVPCPALASRADLAAAEVRITEAVSHRFVGLVEASLGPTSAPSLDALRDVVDAVESISARVVALECPVETSTCVDAARLDVVERTISTTHRELKESLSVLWSTVQEMSRELCARSDMRHGVPGTGVVPPLPLLFENLRTSGVAKHT